MGISFDGSTEYLHYDSPTTDLTDLHIVTVCGWVYPIGNYFGSAKTPFQIQKASTGAGSQETVGVLSGGGDLRQQFDGLAVGTDAPAASAWHQYGVVLRSGSDWNGWLNGVETSTGSSRTMGAQPNELILGAGMGASSTANGHYECYVAEVAVWDAALSDAEMGALGAGLSPMLIRPDKLLRYVPGISGSDIDLITGAGASAGTASDAGSHPAIIRPSAQILHFPPAAVASGNPLTAQRRGHFPRFFGGNF